MNNITYKKGDRVYIHSKSKGKTLHEFLKKDSTVRLLQNRDYKKVLFEIQEISRGNCISDVIINGDYFLFADIGKHPVSTQLIFNFMEK